ncbi:MAG: dihydrofolate reductase [Galactobacter sp.]|uniref:dihydrofolate reductase n=1 Tax=Galactobacter sp. TaxID=2676125 RepID=UPI0025C72113|nr:dihydrofolate reductase family protein [Galactobacter sp.]
MDVPAAPAHPLGEDHPFVRAVRSLPAATVGAIWAQSRDGFIGRGGTMPWHAPEDMKNFAALTWGSPLVMGRRTWESIPARFRPFAGRTSLVITSRQTMADDVSAASRPDAPAEPASTLEAALRRGAELSTSGMVWVAGGGRVYADALAAGDLDAAVVTVLDLDVPDGDTRAPALGPDFTLAAAWPARGFQRGDKGPGYRFELHRKAN